MRWYRRGGDSIFARKIALKCVLNQYTGPLKRRDIGLVWEYVARYGLRDPAGLRKTFHEQSYIAVF